MIIAVDPGPEKSAFVVWDGKKIHANDIRDNRAMLDFLSHPDIIGIPMMVVEQVACYGMPVGADVFETVWWTGRFCQAFKNFERMERRHVKLHICGQPRARDSNIRQALIDRYGAPGTKKNMGLTYGLKKDMWQAFALGVTWWDMNGDRLRTQHRQFR